MKISAATTNAQHLIYDPSALAAARVIAVMVPGALSRISMFDAAAVWASRGYGLAHYRFPGLDGRDVSPPLSIRQAADEITSLAAAYPDKPIRLLGFSTGGPVVLTAGARLEGDVRIALMASAVEQGGGALTFARGMRDLAQAAARVRSVSLRPLWLEYYQVLLFGRQVWHDASLAARAREIIAVRRDKIVFPQGGLPQAHTRDLRRWQFPRGASFDPRRVRLFWGSADPVFSRRQQYGLAKALGGAPVTEYKDQGHLLFASHPEVFEDIYAFFEDRRDAATGAGLSD